MFSTGDGISIHTSKDRTHWTRAGQVFRTPPAWTSEAIPGAGNHFWAPDVSFFRGEWHLYYSVSTFGKNRSAIGLATNRTLDAAHPEYGWKDRGLVVETKPGDNWNAIDPNLFEDKEHRFWLVFGSFWGGIKLTELSPQTGKPLQPAAPPFSLAVRSHTPDIRGAIEAPFLFRHGDWYYLFVSFDFCCRGVNSTYNIRVGRSRTVTGNFVDKDGTPMTEGGGTPVVAGAGRWHGTGHNSVLHDDHSDWIVYHAYDAEDKGTAKLRVEKLTWDKGGWPRVQPSNP